MLGVKSNDYIVFYEWDTLTVARKIDVPVTFVYWSDSNLVALASNDGFFILRYNAIPNDQGLEEGREDAFEFMCEIKEK